MSTNLTPRSDQERAREAAEARAALERRAAEPGVTPFDADEWLVRSEDVPAPEEAAREVDEFLSIVRELRDTPSTRSTGRWRSSSIRMSPRTSSRKRHGRPAPRGAHAH